MTGKHLQEISEIARRLGALRDQVVFVGGAVVDLYATRQAPAEIRVTEDIDCFIEIYSRGKYYAIQEKLRSLGFKEDARDGAPVCRWLIGDITVDIMPTDPDILGFSNRWYLPGLDYTVTFPLPDETNISLLNAPYFLASKFEALHQRDGGIDLRWSTDFEDIIYIVAHRDELHNEISQVDAEVRQFLINSFGQLCEKEDFLAEAVNANFIHSLSAKRQEAVIARIKLIAEI